MATKKNTTYLNNPNLKAAGVVVEFTGDDVTEYIKCKNDPIYFIENYVKVVSLDHGAVLCKLYPYQKRTILAMHNNRMILAKLFRQAGKSTVCAAYIAWYITFNEFKTAAILANKASIAKEIFSRVQFMLECLPKFLAQGVMEWNKTSLELENGSKCFCAASSPSSIRGKSINLLLCDEFAHLSNNLSEEFISSVFPTISASQESKLIIVSTPKGLNAFHKLWSEAESGLNGFVTCDGHWTEHPQRNQKWADEQRQILGELKYLQEVETNFLGSSKSLISGAKLGMIATTPPIFEKDALKVYFEPVKDRSYVCIVDTSRGQHLDYSAFTIIDITEMPYQVVATFKDNTISPLAFPFLILEVCKKYNDAYCLIEVNDLGEMISSTLFYEFEYENVYFTYKDVLNEGMGYPGVRTTKKVKSIGCSTLKDLIEKDQLILNSHDILSELSVFVQKGASYAADDETINDDLTTCLWLFAWLTKQPLFAELTDTNIRSILAKKTEEYIAQNMTPFGHMSDGRSDDFSDVFELDIGKFGGKGVDPLDVWIFSNLTQDED
jgi:hypothetical protein